MEWKRFLWSTVAPAFRHEAIASGQLRKFHEILNQLPEGYATIIRLRSIDQLAFEQIARQLAWTTNAVTKLWYRAVLKFEEKLRESGSPFESQSQQDGLKSARGKRTSRHLMRRNRIEQD